MQAIVDFLEFENLVEPFCRLIFYNSSGKLVKLVNQPEVE